MNEKKIKNEDIKEKKENTEGLNIDKKTLFGIAALLFVILIFVGALTQLLPRGEFQLDENGSVIAGTYTVNEDYKLPIWKIAAVNLSVGYENEHTSS